MNLFNSSTVSSNSEVIGNNLGFLFSTIFGQLKSIVSHVPIYVFVIVGIVGVLLIIMNLLRSMELL